MVRCFNNTPKNRYNKKQTFNRNKTLDNQKRFNKHRKK